MNINEWEKVLNSFKTSIPDNLTPQIAAAQSIEAITMPFRQLGMNYPDSLSAITRQLGNNIAGVQPFQDVTEALLKSTIPNISGQIINSSLLRQINQNQVNVVLAASEALKQQTRFMPQLSATLTNLDFSAGISKSQLDMLANLSKGEFITTATNEINQSAKTNNIKDSEEAINEVHELYTAANIIDWNKFLDTSLDANSTNEQLQDEDIEGQQEYTKVHLLIIQLQNILIYAWNKSKEYKDDIDNATFWFRLGCVIIYFIHRYI